MDEAASTADGLGSVDPDAAPGAESFVDSSPGTAAAAAAARVEAVSALSREGTRDPLKHLFPTENLSKHHVWNNTNGCVYELCTSQRPRFTQNFSDLVLLHKKTKTNVSHLFGI